ncbi:MAG: DUF5666 domain-containing protein, partial [Blastocatellia bacterium]
MHPRTYKKWELGLMALLATLFCLLPVNQVEAGDDRDFEFSGVIQALPSTSGFIGEWIISGRKVRVTGATEIERENNAQIVVGANAKVEGFLQNDGSVIAEEIEIKSGPGGGSNFSFSGNIEELPNTSGRLGDWKVAGIVVHVSATTFIKQESGPVAIGSKAEVEGVRRADGSVDAYKIEIKFESCCGSFEFRGTIESLPGASGRIGQWSVGGRKVNVTASTRLKPDGVAVAVGFVVQVKGELRQDASVDAA